MMRVNERSCGVRVRDEVGGKKRGRTCVRFAMSERGETDSNAHWCGDGEGKSKRRLERSTNPPSY